MTESHSRAQARVFAMYLKNHRRDEDQTETIDDAAESGSLVDYLNSLLLAMSTLDTDVVRLQVVLGQHTQVAIKSLTEIPKVNTSDIKKILQNKTAITEFNSSRAELSVIDDIKTKSTEINTLKTTLTANIDLIKQSADAVEPVRPGNNAAGLASRLAIKHNLSALGRHTHNIVKNEILPTLELRMDLLSSKLERLKVRTMVGGGFGGRPYQLKYDPMYQY
jgi:hypothetical protein